jgi:bifunctional DNase/RNase
MIEVVLTRIIIDEKRQDQIIVLKEKEGERQFPIVIGFLEASSIKMKIANVKPPRPLTHDLMKDIIEQLGGRLEYLVIDKMIENTFHGKLVIATGSSTKAVDCRPSDGIALAVRFNVPIYVEDDILKQAVVFKS